MTHPALAAVLCVALSACAAAAAPAPPASVPPPASPALPGENGVIYARLGETVYVDGPKVTPVKLLEDSRCAQGVQCVWAGRVRIEVRIDLGTGSRTEALTLGKPIGVADGTLELVRVDPIKIFRVPIGPQTYRFGLRFMGGL